MSVPSLATLKTWNALAVASDVGADCWDTTCRNEPVESSANWNPPPVLEYLSVWISCGMVGSLLMS